MTNRTEALDPDFSRLAKLLEGQTVRAEHQPLEQLMQHVVDHLGAPRERQRHSA